MNERVHCVIHALRDFAWRELAWLCEHVARVARVMGLRVG